MPFIITYCDVLSAVKKWVNSNKNTWEEKGIEVKIAQDCGLRVELDFLNCVAQIGVEDAVFAPYRYVCFEALPIPSKGVFALSDSASSYYWYDDADTSIETIITELDKGIEYCLSCTRNK